jgi:hypothetical protein
MFDTMTRYLEAVQPKRNAYNIRHAFESAIDRLSSQPQTSAGLLISATTTLAKIGAADFYALVTGILVKIAAGTNMPSLLGCNAPAGGFNVAYFYVNNAGVVTMLPGTPAATLGGVVLPVPPKNQALIGYLIITYASAFTGGTTVLSTATTVYINGLGGSDPSALTG